ncbi:MAG: TIGR03960 family B12-binding radical SAM protein [Clostridia bacterium]|nr:TIGR03960 family B12-binding radical SAM protein [Clostridia bacterium]
MEYQLEAILADVEKPARYAGGEYNSVEKDWDKTDLHFTFCFPDLYEIGMSHLGIKILYDILNRREDIWAERAFMVGQDMEDKMREHGIPLYSLESKMPLKMHDVIGFTLQYELSYSSILSMLSLAEIPLLACERDDTFPLVCAGGPCAFNPEPLADFIDFFMIGEGEDVILQVSDIILEGKKKGLSKTEILEKLSSLQGVYVPSLVEVEYNDDGTVKSISKTVEKTVITDLSNAVFPTKLVVPFTEAVHDRITLEVMRGCMRGCRFCQAGYIYRPKREKDADKLSELAKLSFCSTGYEEISLSSLSTSDYLGLKDLKAKLNTFTRENMINLALPSLRIDNFHEEALESLSEVRKSSLTFAPEAGTQRMRDIINKNISEETILNTMQFAYENGWSTVKLYFMIGLPFETDEDVLGISELVKKIESLYYAVPKEKRGKRFGITVSVSTFVPKPHTPFQWAPQDSFETILRKQNLLKESLRSKNIRLNWHDAETSVLEAAFARGDRKLGKVILEAHKLGCKLDGWNEYFSFEKWQQAFKNAGVDMSFYNERERSLEEVLPWEVTFCGVTKEFFQRELLAAKDVLTTPNCQDKCAGCGANRYQCNSVCNAR